MSLQRHRLAARLFDVAVGLSNALAGLPGKLLPPPVRLVQIGASFWQSRALYVATRLDLATALGGGSLGVAQLADKVGADADALRRLLRMLAALGVFEEAKPGIYRNNRLSSGLRTDRRDNVRAMILMHNSPEMSRPWFETLEQGIRTGEMPFRLTHGGDLFARMDADPDFERLFAQAMDQVEALAGDSFATSFDWSAFERIIDVGGSKGAKSMAILKRHAHLRAVVVDRPMVIEGAKAHWAECKEASCLDRMRFEAGDVFTSVPSPESNRDLYLLSAVLHCFDDNLCAKALGNVAAAAATTGSRIVVLETVVRDFRADLASAAMDMQMFMGTSGRERTRAEWEDVFKRGGVSLEEIVHLPSFGKMLVLRP